MDFHALDCLIKQQADADGNLPAAATRPSFQEETPAFDSQMRMDKDGRIYRANVDKAMSHSSHSGPGMR